jgi:hypothetical protein
MTREQGQTEVMTFSECISRMRTKIGSGSDIRDEVEFVAAHFHEFDLTALQTLKEFGVDVLERILRSKCLCLKHEDTLADFILPLGEKYLPLWGCVRIEALSVRGIRKFATAMASVKGMTEEIWKSVLDRLLYVRAPESFYNMRLKGDPSFHGDIFPVYEGRDLNGIFGYLTRECGGNVHTKGVVNITCSGVGGRNKCWQVVDAGWNDYWHSANDKNSWICFDFRGRSVSLTGYTLTVTVHNNSMILEWVVEGSNDQNAAKNWTIIDSRNTKPILFSYVRSFKCSNGNSGEFFRFIRIRQTGPNAWGNDHMLLCNVEFFGKLRGTSGSPLEFNTD